MLELSVATLADAARRTSRLRWARSLPKPHGLHVQRSPSHALRDTLLGGKRLRPFLVLHSARLFAVPEARARRVAAALEAVHTYSLVHDDLPCMDDDDLRRGRPTLGKQPIRRTAVLSPVTRFSPSLSGDLAHPDTL